MNIKLEGNVCVPFTLEIREKVKKAREIQQIRYQNEPGINCNAQMSTALLQKYCVLDEKSRQLLKETSEKYGYSARVIHKLLLPATHSHHHRSTHSMTHYDAEHEMVNALSDHAHLEVFLKCYISL